MRRRKFVKNTVIAGTTLTSLPVLGDNLSNQSGNLSGNLSSPNREFKGQRVITPFSWRKS